MRRWMTPHHERFNPQRRNATVDLGEEEFTVGLPHPMIDNDLRMRRLLQEARDPETAVIMLDVVIGYGAHADPASELGKAIVQAQQEATAAVARLSSSHRSPVLRMIPSACRGPGNTQTCWRYCAAQQCCRRPSGCLIVS
jgi:hypothetical protein